MKRLLLPLLAALALPTAVNALPWNNDIVVKTKVGEKFIVKDSTVTTIFTDKSYLIKEIEKTIDQNQSGYDKCVATILGKRQCKNIWKPEKYKAKYLSYINKVRDNFPDENLYEKIFISPQYLKI